MSQVVVDVDAGQTCGWSTTPAVAVPGRMAWLVPGVRPTESYSARSCQYVLRVMSA